jgi:hypothetical protein
MTPEEENSLDEQYPELKDLGLAGSPAKKCTRTLLAILAAVGLVLLLVTVAFTLFVVIPCSRGSGLCP